MMHRLDGAEGLRKRLFSNLPSLDRGPVRMRIRRFVLRAQSSSQIVDVLNRRSKVAVCIKSV